jgi:hypothetical protein
MYFFDDAFCNTSSSAWLKRLSCSWGLSGKRSSRIEAKRLSTRALLVGCLLCGSREFVFQVGSLVRMTEEVMIEQKTQDPASA